MAGVLLVFVAALQLVVVSPVTNRFDDLRSEMNARFDAVDQRFETVNQRFDAVDQRVDRLQTEVSELRTLGDRISHNTGRIDLLTEQLQAVPTPGR